ncbi:N2-N2-dimethylguanosine tRNA methyltransferase [Striga hermonthica]|uniref:tRNA (guanine(26)-N(2))-dimethyltransferase n=1 Tax=Striga hermonthica TaxID=68872 RepID=A0A9N7RLH4_STRHE|nr:N2-N2-dimethylguanosine tRNA methyltransferase [Striga hermonthica]
MFPTPTLHLKPSIPFTSLTPKSLKPATKCCKSETPPETERGFNFDVGSTFFRRESSTGRDLGVLSAAVHRQSSDSLRVLDAMCGCGVRSMRYLAEAGADFVVANDANHEYGGVICGNLERASGGSGMGSWVVKHMEANRLLTECYLERDYFDLIDVDSFGSESSHLRSALCAVKLDGLLYLTSTDGYSSGGHRPQHVLDAYGAYVRHMPYSNEIGLRMLIGGAVREAAVLGYHVVPLFSYYSYHGPVFRVMLQVRRGKMPITRSQNLFFFPTSSSLFRISAISDLPPPVFCRHYSFISYCNQCGNSRAFSWDELGEMRCSCNDVLGSLVVSGPLWTGPLHCSSFLTKMLNLAEQWGWTGNGKIGTLLKVMIDESDVLLPFGYTKLDEIARRAKVNSPPINTLMHALKKEGYAATRSHIASAAIKTNCPMVDCVRIAKELQCCSVTA